MQSRLVDLVLNLLRKNQYTGTTPSDDELYLVTDDVGITSGDVTNALGYTPYNATNPNGFINSTQVGNGTITLSQDNTTQGSFTTNQSTNATINLKGLYDYYTLDGLSIQGAPTINGAVISDLTESDYPYMTNSVTLPTYWEIWMKFTTGIVPSYNDEEFQYLIGGNSANPVFAVYLNDLDEIEIETGGVTKNTNWAVASNTTYYLRLIWNLDDTYAYNSGLNVVLYNANKQYIDDAVLSGLSTVAGVQLWFGTTYGADRGFDGTIDFAETYINKINYDSQSDSGTAELLWKGVEWILDTKADVDLGNLNSTGKKVIDGQWVTSTQVIASNVSFATGGTETKTYDLTNYLPADGATYEVLFAMGGQTDATNGASFGFALATDIVSNVFVCRNIARSAAYTFAYGAVIIPLTTRQVKVTQTNTTAYTPTLSSLRMCGYRRVGTNT